MKKEIIIINDMEDFMKEISSIVRKIVKDELNGKEELSKKSTKDALFTRAEVCAHLHISYATLHRYVNAGVFICHKMGRRSLFNMKEVEAALIKVNV
ncbi:helix-turn-helix protein [Dysgonomonas alginatilytica]|uniref:Helix-turn-helix protein n=1 Tax=Dysgonomonas alginatilytica TaxID=1605892 RepID=A0A2V3PMB4_9BACT|nr:helix-turn-helix domain-containing protein [Dysgonomonas alginatilytica]PXV61238.1 helix-turn-helix protein [Dysgonomonas alginatilytica]